MKIPKAWNIFPIAKNSKFPPLLKEWETTTFPREKLKGHEGNYGLGTGDISGGVIVFDWDFRQGFNRKEKGFKEVFEEYKKVLPHLVNTLIIETPHGYHFYYLLKGKQYRNTSWENVGYSKTLKTFTSTNKTKFSKYLKGLDTRANGGYVVIPPSKVKDGEYKVFQNNFPIELSHEDYTAIFTFFENDKPQTIRSKFIDILLGKINIHELKQETGMDEHVYWKELYHECWHYGLLPDDLLEGLEKHQKSFNKEKTYTQLRNQKNKEYIFSETCLSKEKYTQYFKIETVPEKKKDTTNIIIPYDTGELYINEKDIIYSYAYKKKVKIEKILDCSFTIINKCYHKKEERFSYLLNDKMFHTDTILDILHRAEPYLRKGLRGRDCLKECISYYSKQLKNTKPKEFLGFDNEWILPLTEGEKNISIIVITDYQQEAYSNAQNIICSYSDKIKEKIKKKLQKFIDITQCEKINLGSLIGWSIAAPFRMYFIKEYDLFPILYNYGPPNTGRSTLEDFWIIDFYGIYEDHLPPNTSIPRLEDHLSKSTFPYSLQDIKESNINRDLISMLQDYSTSLGLFERKKGSKEIEFIKYKIAGINLDSNDILEMFTHPAINERQIFMQYTQKTQLDLNWTQLRKELKKYKLFSFIYEYTKEWTNKELEERYEPILEDFNKSFNTNSSRLLKSASIIRFGLDLFKDVFEIDLEISNDEIIDTIIEGSTKMTAYIVDQWREFCMLAINYDETTQTIKEYANGDSFTQLSRGENPHYLNHKLKLSSNSKYYAYTSSNHEDYKKRFGERNGMKSFVEKLQKGMAINEMKTVEYISARPFQENGVKCKPMGIIRILPQFINEKEVDVSQLQLREDDIIERYGEPPEDE